ncbi:MAG: S8 family serine peptidase [Marinicella sp.]
MSKSKVNTLITASVMSAVYFAGVSNVSYAVDLQTDGSMPQNNYSLTEVHNQDNHSIIPAANLAGQNRYIIRFKEAAVAQYNGVGEYPAIPRRADRKIVVNSPAVINYVNHLRQQQTAYLNQLSNLLGRQINPLLSYQFATNGLAVNLTAAEASQAKHFDQVASVSLDRDYFLDTDAGPQLIGADNVWNGNSPASGTAHGEGVIIGTLDSGTNFDHPSFADVGDDGYDHTNPLGMGNYLGVCDPSNTEQYLATYTCNDKLIGGYDFVNDLVPNDGSVDIPGPEDENGHGTHTSSTSGGNVVLSATANGVPNVAISGVAPHATNIHFDICYSAPDGRGLCPGASSIAAMDQVIADGVVDVVNYSISGGTSPWTDDVSLAFLAATDSGVFVSASAGNSGPGPATLGHVEPWTASVGASTHNRTFVNLLSIDSPPGDPSVTDISYNTSNGPAAAGNINAGIEYAGNVDAGNFEGCNAFPAMSFDGLVALISRGSCSFELKVNNAFAAGAVAVVIHNNAAGGLNMNVGNAQDIPSFSISQADGTAMATYLGANASQTVEILLPAIAYSGQADVMAGFSSRGPSPFEYNKPDVTGPGVSILAAFDDSDPALGTPAEYGIISGTSMSSPHNAGSAALLKELHPTWTPAEIKSALMLTAVTAGVTKEDGTTPADPFDRGAGRIQVDVASSTGLVMNETAFKFLLADPDNGGDPKTLNVASYKNDNCVSTCSFTRKFTSVASGPVDYVASLVGMTGTVSPASFTAMPGQTVTLDVEIDGAALPAGAVSFGELQIAVLPPTIPFTINPDNTAIPDGAYDGTLASMACETITVAGVGSSFGLTVDLALDHTWIGDLVVKLQNPDGDVLGLLSRPGYAEGADDGNTNSFGDSSNLLATSPLTYSDSSSNSAETMGDVGASSAVVCQDDGVCDFMPVPDSVAQPPSTLADLLGGTIDGDWNLCVGDSGSFDTGEIDTVTLNFVGEALSPDLHLPLVVTGFPESPDIEVAPSSLSATLDADMSTDLTLTVINTNLAGAALNWSLTPDGTSAVVIEQAVNGTQGIISDFYTPDDTGAYSADDFELLGDTTIETMFFGGFVNNQNLSDIATAIEVQIYADDNGVPAGHPEDGLNSALVSLSIPIADPSLDLTDNNIGIDVVAANGSAVSLPAGTYWVSVYPVNAAAAFTTDRWNWFAGFMANETIAQLVDPSDLFGGGFTDWTAMDVLGVDPTLYGLNYRFDTMETCGAPWLSVSPTSGSVPIDDSTDLTVTVDSTGLSPGIYTAAVCIDSDDADTPRVAVPVTLTVDGPSDLIFENGFEPLAP